MSATLRDLFYNRYDPLNAATPNRPEYDEIFYEMEEIEGKLWSGLDEEGKGALRRFSLLEAQLRDMCYGDYFAEGFHLAVSLLGGEKGWRAGEVDVRYGGPTEKR